jgi:hypothetical protein
MRHAIVGDWRGDLRVGGLTGSWAVAGLKARTLICTDDTD